MGIVSNLPFLRRIISVCIKKFLDFSDLPLLRRERRLMVADIELLMFEREVQHKREKFNRSNIEVLTKINELIVGRLKEIPKLIRLGSRHDGGYVIPMFASKDHTWVTFGIGDNLEFENEIAKNNQVFCFDHTINSLPKNSLSSVVFFKKGLAHVASDEFWTIDEALKATSVGESAYCIKLDIEGFEWEVLKDIICLKTPPKVLVIEFHGILRSHLNGESDRIYKELKDLSRFYLAVFSNVNNFGGVFRSDFGIHADTVEVTFIHREIDYESINYSATEYESLRSNNNPMRHTLQLINYQNP